MGRNPSVDWITIEREYVFAAPDEEVTFSTLAEKHSVGRSGLAARAQRDQWVEKRQEFRDRLGKKTLEALADKWSAFETENREKRMQTANAALDAFITDLTAGKVKINSKDAIEWIGVMRQEFTDVRNAANVTVIEGQAVEMDPAEARKLFAEVEGYLGAGNAEPDPEPAP